MPGPADAACQIALKEWATVLLALERGEQIVLIRKGGLLDPGSGFSIHATTFLLYPTFEHQAVTYLRDPFQRYFEEASRERAPEGRITFRMAGKVAAAASVTRSGAIDALAPWHIYNDAFATQRLKWQPDQPLVIAAIRAYRLPAPVTVPLASRYVGCKSWVDLDAPVPLTGIRPVIEDAVFATKLAALRVLVPELP